MRAAGILRRVLGDVEQKIHRARVNALSAGVLALIRGGEVGLAALGRAISKGPFKHGIKRADRLLGNQALFAELDLIYAAIVRYVLRREKRPVILLDWTEAGKHSCALTAAVPAQGRAVTIYSVTCPLSQWSARCVERSLLEKLRMLLPPNSKPILVTDAGFRGPWMRDVLAMGWDFITRIRGTTRIAPLGTNQWRRWTKLTTNAASAPRALGRYRLVQSRSLEAELVLFHRRVRRKSHAPRIRKTSLRAIQSQREPWLLATSLTLPPKRIVDIYKSRMQIELAFRDLKSHRFGWGFEDSGCRSPSRIAIQILIAALASLVAMLVGIAAETAGLRTRYQANTITKRRVLSLVALGCAVLRSKPRTKLRPPTLTPFLQFVGIH